METSYSPPPRYLSLFSRATLLFGGFYFQFGSMFFGFGMIFFWVFVMNSTLVDIVRNVQWEEAEGVVLKLGPTNATVNDAPVYKYTFTYQVNGTDYQAESSTVSPQYSAGNTVVIEYNRSDPSEARIQGTSRFFFPAFVGFVILFPLIGLIFMYIGFRKNTKSLGLLRHGQFTRGKLVRKEPTNTTINDSPVYRYVFSFKTPSGGEYEAKGSTHLGIPVGR